MGEPRGTGCPSQIANINPEDYVNANRSLAICHTANNEIANVAANNADLFYGAVAMVPINNIAGAVQLIDEQINSNPHLLGIQLFTRALGESIADEAYQPVFEAIHRHNLCIWLHPIFDNRKPDNNIIFSWEYELSQAMMQLVQAKIFDKYPNIKIIVHHAGAMVPFFCWSDQIHPWGQCLG